MHGRDLREPHSLCTTECTGRYEYFHVHIREGEGEGEGERERELSFNILGLFALHSLKDFWSKPAASGRRRCAIGVQRNIV
jgi:hypothetical protein